MFAFIRVTVVMVSLFIAIKLYHSRSVTSNNKRYVKLITHKRLGKLHVYLVGSKALKKESSMGYAKLCRVSTTNTEK